MIRKVRNAAVLLIKGKRDVVTNSSRPVNPDKNTTTFETARRTRRSLGEHLQNFKLNTRRPAIWVRDGSVGSDPPRNRAYSPEWDLNSGKVTPCGDSWGEKNPESRAQK